MRHSIKQENKIALFSIGLFYILYNVIRVLFFPEQSLSWHLMTAGLGLIFIVFFGLIVRLIHLVLDMYYPFERNIAKRIGLQFIITFTVLLAVRLVPYFLFKDEIDSYVHFKITRELWVAGIMLNVLMVLSIILSIFGYHFFKRWQQEKYIAAELEKEKAVVQYENLKNQLNPHFLFNSLSSLNSLIFENPQLASEFLQQLSKVYRYVLENKDKDVVTINTEVKFVTHYAHLLKTRFEGALNVNFNIAEDMGESKIVPVTLQVLLENATKHNITSASAPLNINVYTEKDYLVVENNLQRKQIIETSNGQGLENLKTLYYFLSDLPVLIEEKEKSFAVKIPLL